MASEDLEDLINTAYEVNQSGSLEAIIPFCSETLLTAGPQADVTLRCSEFTHRMLVLQRLRTSTCHVVTAKHGVG